MSDGQTKKRKFPWKTSYSTSSQKDVETRIGTTMKHLYSTAVTVQEMLALAGYKEGSEPVKRIKDDVYRELVRYLRAGGHETLVEANANDLVLFIIVPTIDEFIKTTGRETVQLFREKQVVSGDGETGEYEEFVVTDAIEIMQEKYIFIVEANRDSLGRAMGQCLLAMKDMGESNHGGMVYGFVTTGVTWRMLRYDGSDGSFLVTNRIEVVFDTMRREQERWMRDFSIIVDCVYAALRDGGVAKKDAVG
ncbi:hypothetical protein BDZ91DRAFT_717287 [Kalaharituber pfeilii]|nr:hypothetical protein BDZ91DRAFT_717287 [Kalaharituber pfeilii]